MGVPRALANPLTRQWRACRRRCRSSQALSEAFPLSSPPPPGSAAPRLRTSRPHGYRANSQLEPRGRAGARCGEGGGAAAEREERGDSSAWQTGGAAACTHSRTHTHATHARLHARRSCNAVVLREAAGKLPYATRPDCGTARPSPAEGRDRTRGQGCALPCRRPPLDAQFLVPAPAPRPLPCSRSWGRSLPLPREGELCGKRISAFVCLKYRFACLELKTGWGTRTRNLHALSGRSWGTAFV